jgi:hypothetical protein
MRLIAPGGREPRFTEEEKNRLSKDKYKYTEISSVPVPGLLTETDTSLAVSAAELFLTLKNLSSAEEGATDPH